LVKKEKGFSSKFLREGEEIIHAPDSHKSKQAIPESTVRKKSTLFGRRPQGGDSKAGRPYKKEKRTCRGKK